MYVLIYRVPGKKRNAVIRSKTGF